MAEINKFTERRAVVIFFIFARAGGGGGWATSKKTSFKGSHGENIEVSIYI